MDKLQMMRFFVSVAKTGGFTAVASSANTSTACISRAITRLEQHLSTRLLNRTTRKLSLTPAGTKYLYHCEQILNEIYDAEREAAETQIRPAGVIKVHVASGLGSYSIVKAIADYQSIFAEVTFDLAISDKPPDLVGEGFDVSIVIAESLSDSNFVSQRLGKTHGILCASPQYLNKHGTPLTLADLIEHKCVALADAHPLPKKWTLRGPNGQDSVVQLNSTFTVNTIDALKLAIENDMGIGLQTHACARHSLEKRKLQHILPDYRSADLTFFAIYSSRRYLDAKIKTWVNFLKNVLDDDLACSEPQEVSNLQARYMSSITDSVSLN